MFLTRLVLSLAEFFLSVALSVIIIYWSYRSFVRVNSDYDVEGEIRRGNVAVALLISALMAGAAIIFQEAVYPVVSLLRLGLTDSSSGPWRIISLVAYAAGHLIFGFLLSIGCVQFALRIFARLSSELHGDREIRRGNTAVAVVMASVILTVSLFLRQGVSSLTKSLIPQPELGSIQIMR